jgi:hypothetical protein
MRLGRSENADEDAATRTARLARVRAEQAVQRGNRALPQDVRQQPLSYDGVISTLESVDGEPVIVRIYLRDEDPARASGAASMVGELRHQTPGRYDSDEFSLASPYPDGCRSFVVGR